ncbi:uncharacterized protein B0I36DRAFT_369706 [Microdochium trichocladiopsis]|uniref:Uncharacterized protein n=1 Tax=Microdochium trichocladiopsis TaxID=1682393 RepID=A0A9P8XR39_9PEZI|nr:uncharacterized protein B0I36DRAFT_369706 [Microdochium trichocladiopsis]KAH7012555.1 hypothetical protein B0I36DRAFT_369706 [Microdochium trichocladiopsis]
METPLDRFFQSFEGFKYDPLTLPSLSFTQLKKCHGDRKSYQQIEAPSKRFHKAIDIELEDMYGSSNDLAAWQALCRAVVTGGEVGRSITSCKKILQAINVNIFDLVYCARHSIASRNSNTSANELLRNLKTFPTIKALKNYSRQQNKVFPLAGGGRVNGDQSAALKAFLRPLNRKC